MMDHIPFDAPVVPLVTYSENNIPQLNGVVIPPGMEPYASAFIVELINRFVSTAEGSILRMFSFNHAVRNYWNNPEFIELVNLALLFMAREQETHKVNPAHMLRDVANNFAAYYTSVLPFKYNYLHARLAGSAIKACSSNFGLFKNLKTELMKMNPYQQPQQGQWVPEAGTGMYVNTATGQRAYPQQLGMQPMAAQQPMMQNHLQPAAMHTPQMMNPHAYMGHGQPQYVMTPQGMMPVQQMQQHNPGHSAVTMQGMGNYQQNPHSNPDTMYAPVGDTTSTGPIAQQAEDFANQFPAQEEYHLPATPQSIPEADLVSLETPSPVAVAAETNVLKITGGSEMERSRHVVPYIEGIHISTSAQRHDAIFQSVKESLIIRKNEDGSGIHPDEWITVDTIEAVHEDALVTLLDENGGTDGTIYRGFYKVPHEPYVVIGELATQALGVLLSATSFVEMARRLRTIIGNLTEDESDTGQVAADYFIGFARLLTKTVNDFFTYNLGMDLTIDNFVTDVKDLPEYLEKQGDTEALDAYKEFQTRTINHMGEITPITIESIEEQRSIDENGEVDIQPLTTISHSDVYVRRFSVTALRINSHELGYEMEAGKSYVVDQTIAPNLYAILSTLYRKQDTLGYFTEADFLVTTDKMVYRLLRGYDVKHSHRIALL